LLVSSRSKEALQAREMLFGSHGITLKEEHAILGVMGESEDRGAILVLS
jgi:hypothetical protein